MKVSRRRSRNVYGGIVDAVSVDFVDGTPASVRRGTIEALKKIPNQFQAFAA